MNRIANRPLVVSAETKPDYSQEDYLFDNEGQMKILSKITGNCLPLAYCSDLLYRLLKIEENRDFKKLKCK